ncbi:hypothetical protein F5X99DRAFT_61558 [Biscogniauxia marginata]|nr:hypothetical protein F5X99DRAFT_61558 [Biscogniauxia marginata]
MASGDPNSYLPLESFSLAAFPRTTHNITWSPDAELAIACDDCVFIFIPEFSAPFKSAFAQPRHDALRQYDEAALRFPVNPIKGPELNRHLFDVLGRDFPRRGPYEGSGSGTITSQGGSMNHVVALEWSPCGLGRTNRSVLAVLTSTGILTIYYEGASDAIGTSKLGGRNSRALRSWAAAWSVGGGLLLPAAEGHSQSLDNEYVTAFAWAREFDGKRAALAYENDEEEIVIILIQVERNREAPSGGAARWRVEEVARFAAGGPHPNSDPTDPDYAPSGSSFALSWSPWLNKDNSRASILSYTARGYVGFRQVMIEEPGDKTGSPAVRVGDVDASGVCLYLAPDAFVVWEDLIWTISGSKVCRGIIATPARVQAFQLPFDATSSNPAHTADECGSAYPLIDNSPQTENPITGLVIHPPSVSHPTSAPSYSLVRLSATSENKGWHQTNLPLPSNPEDPAGRGPQWVTEISQAIERQLPRALAHHRTISPAGSYAASSISSEDDYDESDSVNDFDLTSKDDDDDMGSLLGVSQLDTSDQVHTTRIRIWGMTVSPGGGTMAVFTSEHSAVNPGRDTYGGMSCRVLFGRLGHGSDESGNGTIAPVRNLSTEARMWEWIYGNGPPVPGISTPAAVDGSDGRVALKDHFAMISRQQGCAFCDTLLEPFNDGKSSRCGRNHVFENCVATRVPILAPGTSNTCGICGSKCLKPEELVAIAPQLQKIIEDEISAELCGGCGGKFIN